MLSPPKTNDEARAYRYGAWAGQPEGFSYSEGYCAYEVFDGSVGVSSHQCGRLDGHGPDELYCKQHARKVAAGEGE